jgi:hypothetical protein
MQPHQPYIGKTEILQWDLPQNEIERLLDVYEGREREIDNQREEESVSVEQLVRSDINYEEERRLRRENYKQVHDQVRDGDISETRLRRAYRDNLRYVLQEVKRLVSYLDCPVVVTADHGEHLGGHFDEVPKYNHPDWTHPVLREVPWFVVSESEKGIKDIRNHESEFEQELHREDSLSEADVDDRLVALGYK